MKVIVGEVSLLDYVTTIFIAENFVIGPKVGVHDLTFFVYDKTIAPCALCITQFNADNRYHEWYKFTNDTDRQTDRQIRLFYQENIHVEIVQFRK